MMKVERRRDIIGFIDSDLLLKLILFPKYLIIIIIGSIDEVTRSETTMLRVMIVSVTATIRTAKSQKVNLKCFMA